MAHPRLPHPTASLHLRQALEVDPGTQDSTFTKGDLIGCWRGVVGKRYRIQTSTDLKNWGTVNQLIAPPSF